MAHAFLIYIIVWFQYLDVGDKFAVHAEDL